MEKMKKISIITIYDENNFGNRLQNYAVQEIAKKLNNEVISVRYQRDYEIKLKYRIKILLRELKRYLNKDNRNKKLKLFRNFNQNIKVTDKMYNPKNIIKYDKKNNTDYYIVGSDQVWNPHFGRLTDIELLNFTNKNKVAFSASFGISKLPDDCIEKTKNNLSDFKAISVREDVGKKIIGDLNINKDVEVLIDPTMMLNADEWNKVSKEPKQISKLNEKKYILNYFLGKLSEERKNEINRIAKENDCEVINILDKNDPFFVSGPSEFLWLEKNAFLICTDSFHSSVFAILYNRPFIVFNREDKNESMNSRIETLISKFNLKNREFNGKNITKENLEHDYTETYKILEQERIKSETFLKKALDIDE